MKLNRSAISLAVMAAVGAGSMPASAQVTGVPGEAFIVPLVLHEQDDGDNIQGNVSYVHLRVPQWLGQDFVMNEYTAPNVTGDAILGPEGPSTVLPKEQIDADFRIHWQLFDRKSKFGPSGTCWVSPGDAVTWTTDPDYQAHQVQQNANGPGSPDSRCGPTNFGQNYMGYVVFQTQEGYHGREADFAFEASAYVVDEAISEEEDGNITPEQVSWIIDVPAYPMADGNDKWFSGPRPDPVIGANEVVQQGFTNFPSRPATVEPMAAGIRANNGDTIVGNFMVAGGVQGPYLIDGPDPGLSLHAMWFGANDENRRNLQALMWDEYEWPCDYPVDLPYELNVLIYNLEVNGTYPPGFAKLDQDNGADNASGRMVDLGEVLFTKDYGAAGAINPNSYYCEGPDWQYTRWGYAEYQIPEQGDEANASTIRSAMLAFEAQEVDDFDHAWTMAMMYGRGFLVPSQPPAAP